MSVRGFSSLFLWLCVLGQFLFEPLHAAVVNASYNSANDVPLVTSSYTATGNSLALSLNFEPNTGTSLTVIRMTGLNFIQGEFSNLSHGQMVALPYNGRQYYFTANYYAHEGRDLVLQWRNVKPYAWGSGTYGKLGNNDIVQQQRAVAMTHTGALWGKVASFAAAGGGHTLGLCSDGTVISSGLNANGQLGNNSTTESPVPVSVSIPGVPATRKVISLAAGASHSLALCSDGTVYAWGLNTNGQLGDNSNTQRLTPVSVNTAGALSGKTVVAIAAGASHSMALCSDGKVVTWGLNSTGQLGDNSTTPRNSPVLVVTSGILSTKTVIGIAAGASHCLALCSDGTVAAWGSNASGQLGDSTNSQRNSPVAVTTASGALFGKAVTMVAGGGSHSLARCSDGSVAAWGLNGNGQLGNDNNSNHSTPVAVSTASALGGRIAYMVAAGASHSIAHCTDGTVATWGLNASGQLGDNSTINSNVPVTADTSGLQTGGFAAVTSGSSANHTLALAAFPAIDLTNCGIMKQVNYTQSSSADPALEPDAPYSFYSYANAGPMSNLLATSTLTLPLGAGGSPMYETGTTGLFMNRFFQNQAALDAAYPVGNYLMTLQTTTPNTYPVSLSLGAENFPAVAKILSFTNAAWENGALKITDPALPVTINWSNPGSSNTIFYIDNSDIRSDNSTPSFSFTIPGNSLNNNSFYRSSVQFMNGSSTVAVPGLPDAFAHSSYHTQLQFLIQVGTPVSDAGMYLVMKNHNQVQSSNSDPVDAPNNLPDSDLAPYALAVEAPISGTVSDPSSNSISLKFHADTDGGYHEHLSSPFPTAAALNAAHPNGTYTFPGGVTVNMPGDSYPSTAKILTVNGGTPVWNAQGQLALDPTIDNTITWTNVNVPNFENEGHQEIEFVNYQDFNFENIEEERGAFTPLTTPTTSLFIAKSTMTPTFTYVGQVKYADAASINDLGGGAYAVGVYETGNQFMAVAMKPQTITFGIIPAKVYPRANFSLSATASSGLPVLYEVVSGPAVMTGNSVSLNGVGTVIIRAQQAGNDVFASASSVTQSFTVSYASDLAEFRAVNGLAMDGSQDLLTPGQDGVPNLLKYAFHMIGSGTGQATSLNIPNVQVLAISGNAGLPRQGSNAGKLTITYIRRKAASNPGVTYSVEFSNTLDGSSWATNPLAGTAVVDITGTDFERVTITDDVVRTTRFARVRVTSN